MTPLPAAFLERPIAHRALHGRDRPENSLGACAAAVAQGYGIEIDLQRAACGTPMVFHDDDLDRLTPEKGPVGEKSADMLRGLPLNGSDERIPTLQDVLAQVAGRVPLLIEIKDQTGCMGPDIGPLERATLAALDGYQGAVALMSFNPHSAAFCARHAPHLPVGLTTSAYRRANWPELDDATRAHLSTLPGAENHAFVSHDHLDLDSPRLIPLKAQGMPILTWTIRSPEEEARARRVADNVTFEGYLA